MAKNKLNNRHYLKKYFKVLLAKIITRIINSLKFIIQLKYFAKNMILFLIITQFIFDKES